MAVTHLEVGKTYRFDVNNVSENILFLQDADTVITILSTSGQASQPLPAQNIDYVRLTQGEYIAADSVDDTLAVEIEGDLSFIFTPTQVGSDGSAGFPYITEVQTQNPVLDKIVKVTPSQYETLKNGGTVGPYTGLDPNFLYLVKDNTVYPDDSQVVHKAGDETITGDKTFTTGITISGDGPSSKIYYNDKGWLFIDEDTSGFGFLTLGNLKLDGEIPEIRFLFDGVELATLSCDYGLSVVTSNHGFGGPNDWYFAMDYTGAEAIHTHKNSGVQAFLTDSNDYIISKVDLDNHQMIYPWGIKIGAPEGLADRSRIQFYQDEDGMDGLIISYDTQGEYGEMGVADISSSRTVRLYSSGIDILANGNSGAGNIIFSNKTAGLTANVTHYYALPTNGSNNYGSPTLLATELDLPKIKRFI